MQSLSSQLRAQNEQLAKERDTLAQSYGPQARLRLSGRRSSFKHLTTQLLPFASVFCRLSDAKRHQHRQQEQLDKLQDQVTRLQAQLAKATTEGAHGGSGGRRASSAESHTASNAVLEAEVRRLRDKLHEMEKKRVRTGTVKSNGSPVKQLLMRIG